MEWEWGEGFICIYWTEEGEIRKKRGFGRILVVVGIFEIASWECRSSLFYEGGLTEGFLAMPTFQVMYYMYTTRNYTSLAIKHGMLHHHTYPQDINWL